MGQPSHMYAHCEMGTYLLQNTVMKVASSLNVRHSSHPQLSESNDPAIVDLRSELTFYIIPSANPDGYVYTWTTVS